MIFVVDKVNYYYFVTSIGEGSPLGLGLFNPVDEPHKSYYSMFWDSSWSKERTNILTLSDFVDILSYPETTEERVLSTFMRIWAFPDSMKIFVYLGEG